MGVSDAISAVVADLSWCLVVTAERVAPSYNVRIVDVVTTHYSSPRAETGNRSAAGKFLGEWYWCDAG